MRTRRLILSRSGPDNGMAGQSGQLATSHALRNPFRVEVRAATSSQGSSFLATLGFGTKPLWGLRRAPRHTGCTQGFSLLEMMVAVTLLLIIIAALLAMFYQTQRAFRLSATQADILESGRAAMEKLAEELPEITPSFRDSQINLYAAPLTDSAGKIFPLLVQPRPTPAAPRVNLIQDIFFLRQHNDEWVGTGYFVVPSAGDPVGTLYRYEQSVFPTNIFLMPWLFTNFQSSRSLSNSHRMIDRVVNLRLSPYDSQGQFMTNWVDANYSFTNSFTNSFVPSYLELELGIVEPRAYEHYKALAEVSSARASAYLSNHVEKVHLFRQRISIRTAQ